MSQGEVLEYLTENKDRFVTIPEICSKMDVTRSNITRSCLKLEKSKDVIIKREKVGCFIRFLIKVID